MKNILLIFLFTSTICAAQVYPSDEFSVIVSSGDRTIELAEPLYQTSSVNYEKDMGYGLGAAWRHNFDANNAFRIRTLYTDNKRYNAYTVNNVLYFDQTFHNQTLELAPGFTYGIRMSTVEFYALLELPLRYIGKVEVVQTSSSPIIEPAYNGFFPAGWSTGLGLGLGSKHYFGNHLVLGAEMYVDYSYLSIQGDYTRIYTNLAPYPIFQSTNYEQRSIANLYLKAAVTVGFVF